MTTLLETTSCEPVLVPQDGFAHLMPIPLRGKAILIGSAQGAHLRLRSRTISRMHAVVLLDNNRSIIRDLSSRKHIYVNGRLVREAKLNTDDLIQIGRITFRYSASSAAVGRAATRRFTPALLWKEDGGVVSMRRSIVVIGRKRDADVVIREADVARAHAMLYLNEGSWYLRDLCSPTGTRVNDQRVELHLLRNGDVIQVGSKRLQFELSAVTGPLRGPDRVAKATICDQSKITPGPETRLVEIAAISPAMNSDVISTTEPVHDARDADGPSQSGAAEPGLVVNTVEIVEPLVEPVATSVQVSSEKNGVHDQSPSQPTAQMTESASDVVDYSPLDDAVEPSQANGMSPPGELRETVETISPLANSKLIEVAEPIETQIRVAADNPMDYTVRQSPTATNAREALNPTSDDASLPDVELRASLQSWGPLAMALAAQSQPEMLKQRKSPTSQQTQSIRGAQPSRKTRRWIWLCVAIGTSIGGVAASWAWARFHT